MLTTMKSQGMPISFIVIAAMAVLVLVVVLLFFFGGFRTEAVTAQTAINTCSSKCILESELAKTKTSPYSDASSRFCAITQDVKSVGTGLRCDALTTCEVTIADGTRCTLKCGTASATTSCCVGASC